MKYIDKLDLSSQIYKYSKNSHSKTPSKSPLKQPTNPSDLFRKVCCPNCKYSFKVLRQEALKEMETNAILPKTTKTQQRHTQTDGIFPLTDNNLNKFYRQSPRLSLYYEKQRGDLLERSQLSRLNSLLQVENLQSKYVNESDYKFKPLSVSPINKKSKSKKLLQTLRTEKNINSAVNVDHLDKQNAELKRQMQKVPNSQVKELSSSGVRKQLFQEHNQKEIQKCGVQTLQSPKKLRDKLNENQDKVVQSNLVQSTSKRKFGKKGNLSASQIIIEGQKQSDGEKQVEMKKNGQKGIINSSSLSRDKQISEFITELAMKNTESCLLIGHYRNFCQELSDEIELPSYFKMLNQTNLQS